MTIFLKQSTAVDVVIGPFVDDTDGKTAETALTISQADCQLTKNAGAMAQKNNATAASHLGGGHYKVPFSTTDTNTLGLLRLYVNEAGALPVWLDMMVMPANVWDSLFGADRLQVHAAEISNDLITAAAIADGAFDAGALATDATNEIRDAIWNLSPMGREDPNTMSGLLVLASADVWEESLGGHTTAGSAGKALSDAAAAGGATPAEIADAVWDEATADHVAAGSAGLAMAYARDGSSVYGSTTAANNLKKAFDGSGSYTASTLTVGAVTSVTNAVGANLLNINGTAALFNTLLAILGASVVGTVMAGTNTSTVITTNLPSTAAGRYVGKTLVVTSGSRAGEGGKLVGAYSGASKQLTVEALTGPLAVGDEFVLLG